MLRFPRADPSRREPRHYAVEAAFARRRFGWRIARQIRIDRQLPEGEVVRVTLHDRDGRVLFEGEVG